MKALASSGLGNRDELLSEFLGQTFEGALLGLQYLVVVVSQALLDVRISLNHDTPEPGSELPGERHGGDESAAPCCHAPVEASQRDVFAAHQSARHQTEKASGPVTPALGPTLSLATIVIARRQSRPSSEVLLGRPFSQVSPDLNRC